MSNNALVGLHDPAKRLGVVGASGGRSFEFTRVNTTPTFPCKKIEDFREARASVCTERAVHAKTVTFG